MVDEARAGDRNILLSEEIIGPYVYVFKCYSLIQEEETYFKNIIMQVKKIYNHYPPEENCIGLCNYAYKLSQKSSGRIWH